jgi:AI-2 transport protein TqsA
MSKNTLVPAAVSPVVYTASLIVVLAGAYLARTIVTPLLLALFISVICAQPIAWLEKRRVPKAAAMLIVLAGLLLLFAVFAVVIGSTLTSFSSNVADYESTLTDIGNSFTQFLKDKGLNVPDDLLSGIIQPAKVLALTASAVNGVLGMMGRTFLIFLIVLFILMEIGSFSVKVKAIRYGSGRSDGYFSDIARNIRQYLWIKTIVSVSVGVLIYFALLIMGLDYPLLWALIAILMNYIPNIGSVIATVPVVLFALVQLGLGGAIWTLVLNMVIHNLVGNFIEPKIMGKGLGLSTLVVFISLMFWGFMFGTVGMILSVPITMTIKIILEQDEKTRWAALLLGTPGEAETYLKQKEDGEKG